MGPLIEVLKGTETTSSPQEASPLSKILYTLYYYLPAAATETTETLEGINFTGKRLNIIIDKHEPATGCHW